MQGSLPSLYSGLNSKKVNTESPPSCLMALLCSLLYLLLFLPLRAVSDASVWQLVSYFEGAALQGGGGIYMFLEVGVPVMNHYSIHCSAELLSG